MTDLGVGDLIYQGEIYDRMNSFDDDLPFYRKWCDKTAGPVLELCCGTGRLTIPLAKAGIDITGLDITPTMLDRAREKAAEQGLRITDAVTETGARPGASGSQGMAEDGPGIEFASGDMRAFDLGRKFGLIFIPFNSLQHTYSIEDLERVFDRVKAHLAPGGTFIFDIFSPSIHLMVDRERTTIDVTDFTLSDGRKVVVRENCRYDAAAQVNRVKWLFSIGGLETIEELNMRCFYPLEMDAILRYNGFEIRHKFGWFDEAPFVAESMKQIFVCGVENE